MPRRRTPSPAVPSLFTMERGDRGDIAGSASARGDIFRKFIFTGGIDRSLPPNMIPDSAVYDLENMWYQKESPLPSTRPGLDALLSTTADNAVTCVHVYDNPVDSKSYCVFTNLTAGGSDQEVQFFELGQTALDDLEDGDGVAETVGSTYQPVMVTYNDKLVLGVKGQALRVWGGALTATLFTQSFLATATPAGAVNEANDTITLTGLSGALAVGDQVMFATVSGAGVALPGGLSASTRYFVQDVSTDDVKFATTLAGGAINLTAGVGTCRVYKVPAKAKGKLTVDATDPVANDTLTVGGNTWTFETTRSAPFEIAIDSTASTQAGLIAAAVNMDSFEVTAAADSSAVYFTANKTGTAGNAFALSVSTTYATVNKGFCGGVNGQVLDFVTTYEAPVDSAVLLSDRNRRLVVTGPSTDRISFCTPGNEFSWASGLYGYGEYWDIGAGEANAFSTIAPFGAELWAHKYGNNKEIHRIRINDPLPASWDLAVEPYDDTTAAISSRGAMSALDKHVVLDKTRISVFGGTDTVDEYRAIQDGSKLGTQDDLFNGATSTGFIVKDPENLVLYIFPAIGKSCFVYHYASSRWAHWTFGYDIYCGTYCESRDTVLFGGKDSAGKGQVFEFNSRLAQDDDGLAPVAFYSRITGKTLESDDLSEFVLKQTQVDFTNRLGGTATFGLIHDRGTPNTLFTFPLSTIGQTLDQLHALGTITVVGDLSFTTATAYEKYTDFTQDVGSDVAPYLEFTGAAEINKIMLRFAQEGRDIE